MRINTNVTSLNSIESSAINEKNLETSLEKLSSGFRVNKASDDASGLAIADKLRTQVSSITQSLSNANSAISMIQIADKAMGEQSNILDLVKQKLIQASTDTTSDEGRKALAKDINKLLEQFDNIASQTNYNDIKLLEADNGSEIGDIEFQLGETAQNVITFTGGFRSNTDGYAEDNGFDTLAKVKIRTSGDGSDLTQERAQNYLTTINISLNELNDNRANFGSTQNQIESASRNMLTQKTNISSAESVIRDVDYAQESADFSKYNIMTQSSTYAQAQANTRPSDVLRFLT